MKKRSESNGLACTPVACVIYLRVSSDRQAESGLGREAQEAACRAAAALRGWRVASVHLDDGLSGTLSITRRPGLAAAVDAMRAEPGAVLLVHSVSRFARSQRELWTLLDGGSGRGDPLPLVSATEPFDLSTAMGRAFVGMLGVIAALESDLASERTTAALAAAKARGSRFGQRPMAELGAEAAAAVRLAQELYATGEWSHRSLADELNRRGVKSAKGARWHAKTVRTAVLAGAKAEVAVEGISPP